MPAGNPEAYLDGGQGPGKQDKMAALEAMLGGADTPTPDEGAGEEEPPVDPQLAGGGEPVQCQVCGSVIDSLTGIPSEEPAPVEAGMPAPPGGGPGGGPPAPGGGGPQLPPGGGAPPF